MDKTEKEIIKLLTDNARYSNKDLANILGKNESEIEKCVKKLENENVIVKYTAILNSEIIDDKKVQAFIEVKVFPQKLKGFDAVAEEIYNFKEVQSLYLMSGGFDLAIFVEGKDITEVAKFVSEKLSVIDGITSVQTHFILKKYKIEGQVTKPSTDGKRIPVQA